MSMHKGMLGRETNGPGSADQTLADYIRRKNQQEAFDVVAREECCGNPLRGCVSCPPPQTKKLTFDEYREKHYDDYDPWAWSLIEIGWEAAQENV